MGAIGHSFSSMEPNLRRNKQTDIARLTRLVMLIINIYTYFIGLEMSASQTLLVN